MCRGWNSSPRSSAAGEAQSIIFALRNELAPLKKAEERRKVRVAKRKAEGKAPARESELLDAVRAGLVLLAECPGRAKGGGRCRLLRGHDGECLPVPVRSVPPKKAG